jgi:hypothetical protein
MSPNSLCGLFFYIRIKKEIEMGKKIGWGGGAVNVLMPNPKSLTVG